MDARSDHSRHQRAQVAGEIGSLKAPTPVYAPTPPRVKIEVVNLCKIYNTDQLQVHALESVNLEVEDGEFVCLVGMSGCGKTTFLNILAGFVDITSGCAEIDGKPVTEKCQRGVVFQEYALFPWRTALKNVEYGLEVLGIPARRREKKAREYLQLVGLENVADFFPHKLSGGMRQRIAVARALAYEPQVLLMDEPFGALDTQTREELQRLLVDIWLETGKTVVYVTHDLSEAVYLADRIVVLSGNPGRIRSTVSVDLPRPRAPLSAKFIEIQRRVGELVRR